MWDPPQKGYHKLNTDGSWMSVDTVGIGGVIRCEKGIWVTGYAMKFIDVCAAAVELLTIKEGNLIRDVASLLERNWNVQAFHASRTVNFVADKLAIMGRTKFKTGESVPFTYPPIELFETYAAKIPDRAS
uniref:RNase H type-1 domain-containing protein n=1 Tax=Chenopodium quinoa TaxID=63459 RepID=A0A803N1R8_CHEQI